MGRKIDLSFLPDSDVASCINSIEQTFQHRHPDERETVVFDSILGLIYSTPATNEFTEGYVQGLAEAMVAYIDEDLLHTYGVLWQP